MKFIFIFTFLYSFFQFSLVQSLVGLGERLNGQGGGESRELRRPLFGRKFLLSFLFKHTVHFSRSYSLLTDRMRTKLCYGNKLHQFSKVSRNIFRLKAKLKITSREEREKAFHVSLQKSHGRELGKKPQNCRITPNNTLQSNIISICCQD